jgi:hypothetical protein
VWIDRGELKKSFLTWNRINLQESMCQLLMSYAVIVIQPNTTTITSNVWIPRLEISLADGVLLADKIAIVARHSLVELLATSLHICLEGGWRG